MWSGLGCYIVWCMVKNVLDECGNRPRPNPLCPPISLQDPITQKTTILNLNFWHFSCIVPHYYKCLNYTY